MRTMWAIVGAAVLAMMQARAAMAQQPKEDAVDTTAFAVDFYHRVTAGAEQGNVFFSPASVDVALGMTYAGARGKTAEQMAKVLHFSGGPEKVAADFGELMKSLNGADGAAAGGQKGRAFKLVMANALWGAKKYPFQADFTRLAEKDFAAKLQAVDFAQPDAARSTINKWVASKTQGKIENLLGPGVVTPLTRLVLTNAVYFKSAWDEPFQKSATEAGKFNVAPGKSVDVQMMHQHHGFEYMDNDAMQLLELPYDARQLSMVVLLPKKEDGLAGLENSLTAESLKGWLKDAKHETVDVTLPRFTFSSEMALGQTLQQMGMGDAFDSQKADFSGISTLERLWLSAVIHKAFVAVDEDGTEAAAATAVVMRALAMRPTGQPKKFAADHPFVFLIRENATGEILFMGRLCDPAKK